MIWYYIWSRRIFFSSGLVRRHPRGLHGQQEVLSLAGRALRQLRGRHAATHPGALSRPPQLQPQALAEGRRPLLRRRQHDDLVQGRLRAARRGEEGASGAHQRQLRHGLLRELLRATVRWRRESPWVFLSPVFPCLSCCSLAFALQKCCWVLVGCV